MCKKEYKIDLLIAICHFVHLNHCLPKSSIYRIVGGFQEPLRGSPPDTAELDAGLVDEILYATEHVHHLQHGGLVQDLDPSLHVGDAEVHVLLPYGGDSHVSQAHVCCSGHY